MWKMWIRTPLVLASQDYTGVKSRVHSTDSFAERLVSCTECWDVCLTQVQTTAKHLEQLTEQPQFSVELVLSYVLKLLTDPDTAVSAAWYLFDPIAKYVNKLLHFSKPNSLFPFVQTKLLPLLLLLLLVKFQPVGCIFMSKSDI